MEGVKAMKELLFEELALIVRTSSALMRRIGKDEWEDQPIPQMRPMKELVQHLALVPSVDLLILQESTEAEVRKVEAAYAEVTDSEKLIGAMEQGKRDLKKYMDNLSDEQFLHMLTRPFYMEHGSVQAKWLVEIVTHAQHHRAHLFMYLKQLGHEVNMFDLY